MYLRTLLILVVLGALIIFAAINWGAFMTPMKLSVIFANVEAPLGVILLGVVAVLTLLFLLYVVYLQSSALLEGRRHARELHTQRELAEQAEASRFHQLRSFLEIELEKIGSQGDEAKTSVLARLEALDKDCRSTVEQTQNTLAAYLGEIDDKLEKLSSGPIPIKSA